MVSSRARSGCMRWSRSEDDGAIALAELGRRAQRAGHLISNLTIAWDPLDGPTMPQPICPHASAWMKRRVACLWVAARVAMGRSRRTATAEPSGESPE